jgi:hypothetical protein
VPPPHAVSALPENGPTELVQAGMIQTLFSWVVGCVGMSLMLALNWFACPQATHARCWAQAIGEIRLRDSLFIPLTFVYLAGFLYLTAALIRSRLIPTDRTFSISSLLIVDISAVISFALHLGLIPQSTWVLAKQGGLILGVTGGYMVLREWCLSRGRERVAQNR